MADVRLKSQLIGLQRDELGIGLHAISMDFLLKDDGLLDESEQLATAVRVALGTDRLARSDEILPDPDSLDRRGWWGDLDANEIWNGWDIGTRNWLLTRAKITPVNAEEGGTLQRARDYTLEALQPFIDKRIISHVEIEAKRVDVERIEVHCILYRGPRLEIDLRYQLLWDELDNSFDEVLFLKKNSSL
jgi:phage gp46-like protein